MFLECSCWGFQEIQGNTPACVWQVYRHLNTVWRVNDTTSPEVETCKQNINKNKKRGGTVLDSLWGQFPVWTEICLINQAIVNLTLIACCSHLNTRNTIVGRVSRDVKVCTISLLFLVFFLKKLWFPAGGLGNPRSFWIPLAVQQLVKGFSWCRYVTKRSKMAVCLLYVICRTITIEHYCVITLCKYRQSDIFWLWSEAWCGHLTDPTTCAPCWAEGLTRSSSAKIREKKK